MAALLPFFSSLVEAGADEAGRGCLAGPVVAAAVILPRDVTPADLPGLDDSKKLSERRREALRPLIERVAVSWAVGVASPGEIDSLNILNASILAMHRAVRSLSVAPQFLIIDGNRFHPYYSDFESADTLGQVDAVRLHDESTLVPHQCVVKGDGKFLSIAAASVIAKTTRDDIMRRLAADYPAYNWQVNKGYPTRDHYAAIARCGITPLHRQSFKLFR
ncbi:MAG: ribonuclease HII [Marinilabiliaceae bacterium]